MQGVAEPTSVANRNILWTGEDFVSFDHLQRFDIVEFELKDREIDFFCVIEVNDVCVVGYEFDGSPNSANIHYLERESVVRGRLLVREAQFLSQKLRLLLIQHKSASEVLNRIAQDLASLRLQDLASLRL